MTGQTELNAEQAVNAHDEAFVQAVVTLWQGQSNLGNAVRRSLSLVREGLTQLMPSEGESQLMQLRGETLPDQLLSLQIRVHDELLCWMNLSDASMVNTVTRGLALATLAYVTGQDGFTVEPSLLSPASRQQLTMTDLTLGRVPHTTQQSCELIAAVMTCSLGCPQLMSETQGELNTYGMNNARWLLSLIRPEASREERRAVWNGLQNLLSPQQRWELSSYAGLRWKMTLTPRGVSTSLTRWTPDDHLAAQDALHPLLRESHEFIPPRFRSLLLLGQPARLTVHEERRLSHLLRETMSILNSSWPGTEPDSKEARRHWLKRAQARLGHGHPGLQVILALAEQLDLDAPACSADPDDAISMLCAADAATSAAVTQGDVLSRYPDLFAGSGLKRRERQKHLAERLRLSRLSALDIGLLAAHTALGMTPSIALPSEWPKLIAVQYAEHRVNAWETPLRDLSEGERARQGRWTKPKATKSPYIVFASRRHHAGKISHDLLGNLIHYSDESCASRGEPSPC